MIQKGLAFFAVLLMSMQGYPPVFAQANHSSAGNPSSSHAASAPAAPRSPASAAPSPVNTQNATANVQNPASEGLPGMPLSPANPENPANTASPASRADCFGGNCDYPAPHISIATPAPAPEPWLWPQRILWGAEIVLAVVGYVGILIGLSLLRKIERQTRYTEAAAQAAQSCAQAALAQVEAQVRAERPWMLMSVRPAQNVENGFSVMATNRGRRPAQILSTVDEIVSAADEAHLSPTPVYRNEPVVPADPLILLPGESTEILSFSRGDVKRICETEERFNRVEKWEEKIYLYGTVIYRDLSAPEDQPAHQSSWFCWYIHGRQKSGMVMAGSTAYNRHT